MSHPFGVSVVNELELQQLVASGDQIVVLDFWASWCTPCRQLEEDLHQIDSAYKDRISFARIDIDALPEVSDAFDVGRIPTLLALRHKSEISRIDGNITATELQDFLDSLIKQS